MRGWTPIHSFREGGGGGGGDCRNTAMPLSEMFLVVSSYVLFNFCWCVNGDPFFALSLVGIIIILRYVQWCDANRSVLPSGGLMADVPCLDHSLDGFKGYPDDVQTTKHARRTHAWSRCARTSFGAHASPFGASSAHFWIVTRAMSARIEEPSMASNLYIKPSVPNIYK